MTIPTIEPAGVLGYVYSRANGGIFWSRPDPRPIPNTEYMAVKWCVPVVAQDELLAARQELAATRTQLAELRTDLDFWHGQAVKLPEQLATAEDERDALKQQLAEMRGALQDALTNTPSHYRESESGRKALTALASPSQPSRGKCGGCGNEIDPDTCGCGEPTNGYHDNHTPVPMGCDCYRSTRIEPDCAQGGSPADPERQASPALREAAKAGAQMLHGMASMHSSIKYGRDEEGDKFHAQAALLNAFAEGK